MKKYLFILCVMFPCAAIPACTNNYGGDAMFTDKIKILISAADVDAEELALADLLSVARQTKINYGYRVFNVTKSRRVQPADIDQELNDELLVTIFVGDKPPYAEYEWKPKYNGHITSLIMP
jgi:hypothetical protein